MYTWLPVWLTYRTNIRLWPRYFNVARTHVISVQTERRPSREKRFTCWPCNYYLSNENAPESESSTRLPQSPKRHPIINRSRGTLTKIGQRIHYRLTGRYLQTLIWPLLCTVGRRSAPSVSNPRTDLLEHIPSHRPVRKETGVFSLDSKLRLSCVQRQAQRKPDEIRGGRDRVRTSEKWNERWKSIRWAVTAYDTAIFSIRFIRPNWTLPTFRRKLATSERSSCWLNSRAACSSKCSWKQHELAKHTRTFLDFVFWC